MAFLGYDPSQFDIEDSSSLCIIHIDGNRSNNAVSNLEIVTRLEVILMSTGKM